MAIGNFDTGILGDSVDGGVDYALPDYSNPQGLGGGNFNVNIPSGVNISLGGGPIVNTPSVPTYPATGPAIYQRGPYTNTAIVPAGGFAGGNMLLWVIIAAALIYVFVR